LLEELGRIRSKTDYISSRIELLLIEWKNYMIFDSCPGVIKEHTIGGRIALRLTEDSQIVFFFQGGTQ